MKSAAGKMEPPLAAGFDSHAAVTRSLLGWGVLAGPIYLVIGLALAVTREGFRLEQHPLSLLMLGEGGWIQRANLVASGGLCFAAAIGYWRAMNRVGESRWAPLLVAGFALGLLGGGVFLPDPMGGFPPGAEAGASTSGVLHMAFGGVGFLCLGAACFPAARWFARHGEGGGARFSRLCGVVILAGFLGGGALSQGPVGVGLIWLSVIASYLWIARVSLLLWRAVPHPDADRR